MFVAVSQGIGSAFEENLVKTFGIKLMPRKFHKTEMAEYPFQYLAFSECSDIMESRVEFVLSPAESLKASSKCGVLFQDADIHTAFGEYEGAFQTSQSAA